jgi:cell wall-associated NlpC family hydrolase
MERGRVAHVDRRAGFGACALPVAGARRDAGGGLANFARPCSVDSATAFSLHQQRAAAFAAAALALEGAAFQHQGRTPAALDCVGLVVVAARLVGVRLPDRTDYSREPRPAELRRALESRLEAARALEHGGVVLLSLAGFASHVGVIAEGSRLVHAYEPAGRVVVHALAGRWRRRVVALYRLPEPR